MFLQDHHIFCGIFDALDDVYKPNDVERVIESYDEILKDGHKDKAKRMRYLQWDKHEEILDELRRPPSHWMENSDFKPTVIQETKNFEKNMTPKTKRKIKKSMKGKAKTFNFLEEHGLLRKFFLLVVSLLF